MNKNQQLEITYHEEAYCHMKSVTAYENQIT